MPYYEEGGITIWHGQCEDVLPTLEAVDHVITDPPYEAEAHTLGRRHYAAGGGVVVRPIPFDAMTATVRDYCGGEFARLVRRWCLVFCQVEASQVWRSTFEQYGFVYKRACIWVKPGAAPQFTGDRPGMGYETIVAMHPKGRSTWNGGGKHGVFTWPAPSVSQFHPTQKPIGLMRELVALFTDPDDLVLDPFGGSGTTARACKDLGRRCILIEREERYCEIAARRLSQEVFDLEVR